MTTISSKKATPVRCGRDAGWRRTADETFGATICPVCGCEQSEGITVRENRFAMGHEFAYAVCSHCKLVRLMTVPRDMAPYYESYSYHTKNRSGRKRPSGFLERAYRKISALLMRPIERYCPADCNLRVLDIGCARGQYLANLKKRGFRQLKGIEPSPQAVAEKVDPGLDIVCTSLADLESDERFDLIVLNQVFEHLEMPHAMLLKLRSLLAPGGVIVIALPNYNSVARWLFRGFWPGYDAPRHYFTFNPVNLRMLCQRCGLTVNRVRYISRPSQFLGGFQYLWNRLSKKKQRLEDGYFRTSKGLDLLFFAPAYLLNLLRLGDMIELHVAVIPGSVAGEARAAKAHEVA